MCFIFQLLFNRNGIPLAATRRVPWALNRIKMHLRSGLAALSHMDLKGREVGKKKERRAKEINGK